MLLITTSDCAEWNFKLLKHSNKEYMVPIKYFQGVGKNTTVLWKLLTS